MRLSRAAAVGATVLVVAGGGYAAYAENTGPASSYRTALVTKADVEHTLALSGTLSPAGRSDLSFTTSGTVARVAVSVGQEVKAGQVIARLDRTSLLAAVTKAQAQLDSAKARLASDEDAQTSAATSSSSSSSSSSTPSAAAKSKKTTSTTSSASNGASSGSAPSGQSGAQSALLSQIKQQQTDVTASQTAASTALAAAKAALAAEQTACAAESASASSTDTSTASDSASASGTASAGSGSGAGSEAGSGSGSGSGSAPGSACDDAIDAVQTAQTKVDAAQSQLQQALDALASTLATASASEGSSQVSESSQPSAQPSSHPSAAAGDTTLSSGGATGPSSSGSSAPSTSSASGTSGGPGGGQAVTAATLASDQASIDSARAGLITARQSLTGAVLRAPHAGTVGEVDVSAGGSASAGSTAVVVLSPGATDVVLAVTSSQVAHLKVGQVAEVTPAGASKPLAGTITRITPVPDSTGDYPVTVTLDRDGLDVPAGGTAAVDIVVGEADGVLTVPTSAVDNGFVEVLDGATATRSRVVVGVVGSARTQITSGLKVGQEVVLADLATAVPTGSTTNQRRFGGAGGLGGLAGSGTFPGGFSGGGPPGGFGG